jgi:hypothetical protein
LLIWGCHLEIRVENTEILNFLLFMEFSVALLSFSLLFFIKKFSSWMDEQDARILSLSMSVAILFFHTLAENATQKKKSRLIIIFLVNFHVSVMYLYTWKI